jgi:hypothetical protein
MRKTKKEKEYIASKAPEVIFKGLETLKDQILGTYEAPNKVNKIKGGYISYNPSTDCGAETALCFDNGDFFILLGDKRKDLKECKTITSCVSVYKKLIKNGAEVSPWNSYNYK